MQPTFLKFTSRTTSFEVLKGALNEIRRTWYCSSLISWFYEIIEFSSIKCPLKMKILLIFSCMIRKQRYLLNLLVFLVMFQCSKLLLVGQYNVEILIELNCSSLSNVPEGTVSSEHRNRKCLYESKIKHFCLIIQIENCTSHL